ncbi:MAG: hypothetical protein HW420_712 [Candidatus Nitrosotenuis sp.]|nr:hypothetical protein [Candidatus Nitrosotenuis sp.]
MAEIICNDCGKKMFHENEETLKIEESIHKKFCRKKAGDDYSYMHRDSDHMTTFDSERESDAKGKSLLK